MKIAHLADLHLGFRAFNHTAPGGLNQREADVAEAFRRAVDQVIEAKPDLVLIAGDVFHTVRPTNPAILHCFAQFQRLRATGAPIILAAGNHDTPRTSETGSILGLYQALGVEIATTAVERYEVGATVVTAVPSAVREVPSPVPDKTNVLVMHGDVQGYGAPQGLNPEVFQGWAYVALGHYHVCAEVAPNVWYSGAIDYTSTDPWSEVREQRRRGLPGKGWLAVDLGQSVTFTPIPPPRLYLDLEPIDAAGLSAQDVDRAIAVRCAGTIDDAVVRLVVTNLSRITRRALDAEAIRSYRRRALHFQLTTHAPELERPAAVRARSKTLPEIVAQFLGERELPPDVDRAELAQLAAEYMELAATAPDPYMGV